MPRYIIASLVWQEVEGIRKCAILAANGCFIGFNEECDSKFYYQWSCDHVRLFRIQGQEGDLVAKSQVAGEDNVVGRIIIKYKQ